jgi:hypothetical protein
MTPSGSLRPFFSYFGGKWRVAPRYPPPVHTTICEPFAGSAGYALRYPDRRVVLHDLDPIICRVWAYLIAAQPADLLALPDLLPGQTTADLHDVDPAARDLIGFWLNKGTVSPCRSPSKWMRNAKPGAGWWGPGVRQRLASQVPTIRHWRVTCGPYTECVDAAATWFIDPPYQVAGHRYRHGSRGIDYPSLSQWCRNRTGQVIVCENDGADWLPFQPFASIKATHGRGRTGTSSEVVWRN